MNSFLYIFWGKLDTLYFTLENLEQIWYFIVTVDLFSTQWISAKD